MCPAVDSGVQPPGVSGGCPVLLPLCLPGRGVCRPRRRRGGGALHSGISLPDHGDRRGAGGDLGPAWGTPKCRGGGSALGCAAYAGPGGGAVGHRQGPRHHYGADSPGQRAGGGSPALWADAPHPQHQIKSRGRPVWVCLFLLSDIRFPDPLPLQWCRSDRTIPGSCNPFRSF